MSLHVLADHMASKGRNGDSMLVHMTPGEVAGLHALALKHGGELTINPDTGLPEANFLKSLLPMLAGAALNFFVPGLGAAVGGAFGVGAAAGTGIAVGGLTTLATGSLSRGLMAGMGAYGGAGLAEGFANAGANAMTTAGVGDYTASLAERGIFPTLESGAVNPAFGEEASKLALETQKQALARPLAERMSAGFDAAATNPLGFAKDNFKPLAAAAAPIMADMMVPTTTKMPDAQNPGYIRQKVYDPGTQTYRSLTPVKANEWKDRSFSDIYRGYNGGGIVALAAGGTAPMSAADAQKLVEAQYATIGRSGVGAGTNQIDEASLKAWTEDLTSGRVSANDLGGRFQTAVTNYMAERPEDQYTQYVKEFQAKQAAGTGTDTTGGVTNLATTGNVATTGADTSGIATLNNTGAATGTTGTNLNAFNNSFTGANINDYIANNNLDAAGITAAGIKFNVDPAQIIAAQNAQQTVINVYRNVLGRDPDPAGLSWWTNQIMNGDRTGQEMYAEFLKSAQDILNATGTKGIGNFNMSLDEAAKDFGGYKSAEARGIADEWVRNTLGREVTDADRATQWYKDAMNSAVMNTIDKAQSIYSGFKDYATGEAAATTAKKIADAKATLAKSGLTEMDVLRQTGKTIAELVGSGINLESDLFKAAQLRKLGDRTEFDFSTITKPKTTGPGSVTSTVLDTNSTTNAPIGTTNPYGNINNPGDLTFNADGTVTVQPNIPGRPYGGFSGMGEVKNAYTQGGGSLGYTPYAPKTAAEHAVLYNNLTGDSEAAYNYLMGKGGAKYPTKSGVGEIARPYREATMGYPASTNKAYNYDAATGKMVRNPDYVAPGRDAAGNVNYTLSLSEIKKYLTTNPLTGQALFDWAQENGASAQDVADATGRKLSDVYAEFRAAAKKTADDKKTATTTTDTTTTYDVGGGGASGANGGMVQRMALGGMAGYAVGGGLGSLGSYSDGGRLLKGPGDGVSDSIPATIGQKQQPARLADGEFVIPARIVSELGNGSTDAGAKKLYAMMDRVQRARGKTTGKNKVAANSRADKYLPA